MQIIRKRERGREREQGETASLIGLKKREEGRSRRDFEAAGNKSLKGKERRPLKCDSLHTHRRAGSAILAVWP